MTTRLTLIHALSPLHAGTGQAVGAIDLPIARERPTGIPLLPGSSIKGALRARITHPDWQKAIFGPQPANASEHAGAVQFADAHLLLLPVRSLWGTFAWVSSPYILQRFTRDLREAGIALSVPKPFSANDTCLVPAGSALKGSSSGERVILEDLDFKPQQDPALGALCKELDTHLELNAAARLCIVHDDVMSTLMETATEVCARIRLDPDKKTVDGGALWYEESLPTESVLFGLAVATDAYAQNGAFRPRAVQLLDHIAEHAGKQALQLGGKATVGRGVCRMRLVGGAT